MVFQYNFEMDQKEGLGRYILFMFINQNRKNSQREVRIRVILEIIFLSYNHFTMLT